MTEAHEDRDAADRRTSRGGRGLERDDSVGILLPPAVGVIPTSARVVPPSQASPPGAAD